METPKYLGHNKEDGERRQTSHLGKKTRTSSTFLLGKKLRTDQRLETVDVNNKEHITEAQNAQTRNVPAGGKTPR